MRRVASRALCRVCVWVCVGCGPVRRLGVKTHARTCVCVCVHARACSYPVGGAGVIGEKLGPQGRAVRHEGLDHGRRHVGQAAGLEVLRHGWAVDVCELGTWGQGVSRRGVHCARVVSMRVRKARATVGVGGFVCVAGAYSVSGSSDLSCTRNRACPAAPEIG